MRFGSYIKYSVRFLFLQTLLTLLTINYLNAVLISKEFCEQCVGNSFLLQINNNLWEDRNRFFSFIPEQYINIDIFAAVFIFVFLIILYSTKFYTYVNELSFSIDRNYLDEFISIYLLWTTTFIIFLTMFRVSHLISRGYLFIFTFIVPLILLLFRNSEFLSSVLGRSVTNENSITFNLEDDSIFRNLRILTFRNTLKNFSNIDLVDSEKVIALIDAENKKNNVNLIVLNFNSTNRISEKLESFLVNLNKKVLIISKDEMIFNNYFLKRDESVSNFNLTYFNNDIQYGSKYIIKRILDISLSVFGLLFFSPILLGIYTYIRFIDGNPSIIKQNRVGLHGKQFKMYKFRTMKNNAHELRDNLQELNKNDDVIFKIENDPRLLKGTLQLRNWSLDELPQLINVLLGNMSIVGPRPLFEEDTKLFSEKYMRRLNVLPGITGLLQINERNTSEFETWYKYDIEYIENWTLYLDLKIILKTPFSLFKSKTKGI
ncbi:MAG: sugar transferase [Actinobacteria bacterium]|nr:sugar transferase [Actinomycetota bacterium]|tara:strand:- start:51 stop:1514 length:1464 start_codon:yes stop_codon:yes gene_type:complete